MVGKKAGDSFDLPLTFPEDYGSKKLAGAKVTFKVTVKEVHEFKLPELTDEYAKTLAPDIKDVAGLKADIKNELEARSNSKQIRNSKTVIGTDMNRCSDARNFWFRTS